MNYKGHIFVLIKKTIYTENLHETYIALHTHTANKLIEIKKFIFNYFLLKYYIPDLTN